MGAIGTRLSLRPLSSEGQKFAQTPDAIGVARSNGHTCQLFEN